MAQFSFSRFKEYLQLFVLNGWVQVKNFWEHLKVCLKYYSNYQFAKADICLMMTYLFDNPFKLSKRFLTNRGEKEVYAYGETPLSTLDEIVRLCKVQAKDVVFELGCGRGATCFWLNTIIGCRVVGIDYLPAFIQRADRIRKKLHMDKLEFRLDDIVDTDLTGATVVYLYGTCLDEAVIKKLIQKFSKLPPGTKIITISYPLADFCEGKNPFELMKRFEAPFTWGQADVYLQLVK